MSETMEKTNIVEKLNDLIEMDYDAIIKPPSSDLKIQSTEIS